MDIEVPWPEGFFLADIIHYHGLTGFTTGEAKEVLLLQMLGDHDKKKLMFFFLFFLAKCFHGYKERREEEGEKTKHEEKSQNGHF